MTNMCGRMTRRPGAPSQAAFNGETGPVLGVAAGVWVNRITVDFPLKLLINF
jgi:hypothetical protein